MPNGCKTRLASSAAVIAIALRERLDFLALSTRFAVVASLVTACGSALMMFSGNQGLSFFGLVFSLGTLMVVSQSLIAQCCRRASTYLDLLISISLAYALSLFVWMTCFFLSPSLIGILDIALAPLAICLFSYLTRTKKPVAVIPQGHYADRKVLVSPVLASYAVIVGATLGLLLAELLVDRSLASATITEEMYTALSCLVAIGIIAIDLLFARKKITITPLAVLTLILIALVLQAQNAEQNAHAIYITALAAYSLFTLIITSRTARFVRKREDVSGTGAFAAMLLAHMLGLVCGSLAALLLEGFRADAVALASALLVCACTAVSFIILPGKTKDALISLARYPNQNECTENEKPQISSDDVPGASTLRDAGTDSIDFSAQHYSNLAKERFKLTNQETSILKFMLQGWTLQAIADREFLSRNTVKTHTANIYKKMGVHSRQECLEAVRDISDSSSKPS